MKRIKFTERGEMPITIPANLFYSGSAAVFLKAAILLILIFYAIFALIVVRQVDLMARTLITKVSSILKAVSIIHAGISIGLIVLAWGLL